MTPFKSIAAGLVLFLFLNNWVLPAQTAISDKRIQEVLAQFSSHTDLIDSLSCVFQQAPVPVLSVVAPEWVRYSMVRDLMETKALEWAYTRYGREAADFSIGIFQMKPSFIEDLEKALPPCLQAQFGYRTDDLAMQRKLRVARLKDIRWQFCYAYAFYILSRDRLDIPEDEAGRVSFIAAAYNYGFTRPTEGIRKWEGEAVFPYGRSFRGQQESYSQVALRFYANFLKP